jgi:hypothetical protein
MQQRRSPQRCSPKHMIRHNKQSHTPTNPPHSSKYAIISWLYFAQKLFLNSRYARKYSHTAI